MVSRRAGLVGWAELLRLNPPLADHLNGGQSTILIPFVLYYSVTLEMLK